GAYRRAPRRLPNGSPAFVPSTPAGSPMHRKGHPMYRGPPGPPERPTREEPALRDKEHVSPTALLEGSQLVRKGRADVFRQRERTRLKKVIRAIIIVGLLDY